ncbi:MAG TPA: basic secretory protein-like protein [Planctomycetota bacterium]|nr:basic secretory protein-like protein [Planctomycetota bacterium]
MTLLVAVLLTLSAGPQEKAKITVDASEVPDVQEWANKARDLCETWYPIICEALASKDFTPPREVRLVFKDEKKGIAYTSGAKITVVADWIRKHPEDYGMVIHELCHVVQSYPKGVGWITEGIADYIRNFKFEPKPTTPRVNPKSSYKDGYKTAAIFLAWIEKTKDKDIIRKLNEALRTNTYKDDLVKEWTGSDVDALWKEFVATQ